MYRTSKTTALLLALTCTFALLLTACGAGEKQSQSDPPNAPNSPMGTAQGSASVEDAKEVNSDAASDSPSPSVSASQVSLLDIANDFLSDDPQLTDLYEVKHSGWIEVIASGEQIKPGAVYSDENWTADDIIVAGADKSIPWTNDCNAVRRCLWSADYEHFFSIDDYIRCYIDGEYVGDVPHRQHSLDPQDLIRLYQSGEWDGLEPIWSEDDSTYVTVQWSCPGAVDQHRDGRLLYGFINFTEEVDVRPWWKNNTSYEFEPEFLAQTMGGEGEDTFLKYDEASVPLLVDLPNGELTDHETFGDILQIVPCGREQGVLVYTTEGIWLFKAGDLVLGWPSVDAAELLELGYQ